MWSPAITACAVLLLATIALPASAEPPAGQRSILSHELKKLEGSVLQRRGKTPRTSDLLIDQNLRVSGQRLNTLKTRKPNNLRTPFLERQLDRVQRQNRRFHR